VNAHSANQVHYYQGFFQVREDPTHPGQYLGVDSPEFGFHASGRVLRVKGRGVHSAKGTGDLLAEVQIAVPTHLSDDAKEALEAFRRIDSDENPRADLLARAKG